MNACGDLWRSSWRGCSMTLCLFGISFVATCFCYLPCEDLNTTKANKPFCRRVSYIHPTKIPVHWQQNHNHVYHSPRRKHLSRDHWERSKGKPATHSPTRYSTDKNKDFFSFCGKISNLSITPVSNDANADKSATVTFEKETAAKTALLLDNTQLGKSQVHVTTASNIDQVATKAGAAASSAAQTAEDELAQEDKPRSRIVAEYLAQGYVLSDKVIQNAIGLDQKHGISDKFTTALTNFDSKYKVTDKSKAVDQKYQVTGKAWNAWGGLNHYFEQALETPSGQKVRQFYQQGQKQVIDVHNEAKRLADLKTGKDTFSTEGSSSEKSHLAQEVKSDSTSAATDLKETAQQVTGGTLPSEKSGAIWGLHLGSLSWIFEDKQWMKWESSENGNCLYFFLSKYDFLIDWLGIFLRFDCLRLFYFHDWCKLTSTIHILQTTHQLSTVVDS